MIYKFHTASLCRLHGTCIYSRIGIYGIFSRIFSGMQHHIQIRDRYTVDREITTNLN